MQLEKIQPLFDAFKEYGTVYTSRGADYSVTDLLKSPRQVRLFKRYSKEIKREVEILKQLGAFRGNAIHDMFKKMFYRMIQKSQTEDYMVESRLWDRLGGRKISGQLDVLWKDILYDIKTTSVWKKIFGDYIEWEQQLNMYAFMLALIKVKVKELNIIVWYQDWDKHKAREKNYPDQEMELVPVKLWSLAEQRNYMQTRIEIHKGCEELSDVDLPHCTTEEMWAKEDSYAAYKLKADGSMPGKASRVLPSEAEIMKWIKKQSKEGYQIIHRPGERTRCEHWCNVMPFCSQHQEYVGGK